MEYTIPVPFWNQKDITPPLMISLKFASNANLNSGGLRSQLTGALKELGKTDVLHKEAAILSRLLHMMRKIFRQDKGYKCAQMVSWVLCSACWEWYPPVVSFCSASLLKTLRNTLLLNYKLVVTSLRDCCHGGNGPSKQVIEWGLVATLRFGALFHRIHYLAERAVTIFKERFKTGWNWLQATLCCGIISRLWALADFFVAKACSWYSSLLSFLPMMAATDDEWLPKGWTLPSDLASWLGNPSYLVSPSSTNEDTGETEASSNAEKLAADSKQDEPSKKPPKASTYQLSDILKRSNAMELEEDMGEAVVDGPPPEPCSTSKGMKRKGNMKDKLKFKKKRKKV